MKLYEVTIIQHFLSSGDEANVTHQYIVAQDFNDAVVKAKDCFEKCISENVCLRVIGIIQKFDRIYY